VEASVEPERIHQMLLPQLFNVLRRLPVPSMGLDVERTQLSELLWQ
jgi:hypothetical protein